MRRTFGAMVVAVLLVLGVGAPPVQAVGPGANGRLVFIRDGDLYTATVTGTSLRRLTSYGAQSKISSPKWGPGGHRIAYVYDRAVWLMNSDGRGKRRLFEGATSVSWSPDGKRLAYVLDNGTVSTPHGPCSFGRALATNLVDGGDQRLIETTNAQPCTGGPVGDESYGVSTGWSADGKRVYYAFVNWARTWQGEQNSWNGVAWAATDGSTVSGVPAVIHPTPPGGPFPVTVDTAPTRLNYVYSDISTGDRPSFHPIVESNDGSYLRPVNGRQFLASYPTFSPDNNAVLYTEQDQSSAANYVWRVSLRTQDQPVRLFRGSQADWQPVPR